jgi:hypothetical protein
MDVSEKVTVEGGYLFYQGRERNSVVSNLYQDGLSGAEPALSDSAFRRPLQVEHDPWRKAKLFFFNTKSFGYKRLLYQLHE